MTTAGFATADYTEWSALAAMTLLALMFVGASAGSTGGSIKVVRHVLMARIVRRELDQTVHREIVSPIRLNGITVDERALRSVVLTGLMWLGRLEIIPIAVLLTRNYWRP